MQRILPLEPPYDPELQLTFDAVMPMGVPPLKLFRTVGRNRRVLQRMIAGGLLDRGSISLRQRELLILRTTALCRAEYEWGVHVAFFNTKAGFSTGQLADTCADDFDANLWLEDECALLSLADTLHRHADIDEKLWIRLRALFEEEQIIECIMICGLYRAVSYVINGLRVELEDMAPRYP